MNKFDGIFWKLVILIANIAGGVFGLYLLINGIRFFFNPTSPNDGALNFLIIIAFAFGLGGYLAVNCTRMLFEFFKKDGQFRKDWTLPKNANNNYEWVGTVIVVIALLLLGWWFLSGNSETTPRKSEPHKYYESQGYECSDDCSGHDAGYEWAEDNDVCDEDYSDSYSNSFDEGVRTYAEDNC